MIKRIATQAVYVTDQKQAEQFWTEKVGFEVVAKRDMRNGFYWLEVKPKGAESCLVLYPKFLMKDAAERRSSIVFECDDVDQTYEELKGQGVEVGNPPEQMMWGKFSSFKDPDGNEFAIKS